MATVAATTPKFLLGVGTQKAGTSWLYDYLNGHDQVAMGPVKEFHFFNLLRDPERHPGLAVLRLQHLHDVLKTQIKMAKNGKPFQRGDFFVGVMDTIAMQFEPERYRLYFDRLRAKFPTVKLIGEITPNYCSMEAEDFRFARAEIEKMGLEPRVVFIMREPVERCYSQLRMEDREKAKSGNPPKRAAKERLLASATNPRREKLTRYERTIPALEAVFEPGQLHFAIYEDLFNEAEVRRLCGFLGIDYKDPNFETKSNASPREEDPDPADVAKIREHYAETYRFCRERFGAERIDRLWGVKTPAVQ